MYRIDDRQSSLETFGLATFFLFPLLLPAIWSGHIQNYLPPQLRTYFPTASPKSKAIHLEGQSLLEACKTHTYATEIISLDPLLIYITNFTSPAEAEALIELG
jgi:prolyl 4-hydroxylase